MKPEVRGTTGIDNPEFGRWTTGIERPELGRAGAVSRPDTVGAVGARNPDTGRGNGCAARWPFGV